MHYHLRTLALCIAVGLAGYFVGTSVIKARFGADIQGMGTPGRIPQFVTSDTITDSPIREANGNIAIGANARPQFKTLVNDGRLGVNANTTGGLGALVVNQNGAGPIATLRSATATEVIVDADGNVGIGTAAPGSPLEVAGKIHSTSDGFMFPDGTVQTTAAPFYPQPAVYFEADSTVIFALDNPYRRVDLTGIHQLSAGGIAWSEMIPGKVSHRCVEYSGDDWVSAPIDDFFPRDAIEATVECWVLKDNGERWAFSGVWGGTFLRYGFELGETSVKLVMDEVHVDAKHGLANAANAQWVHLVGTYRAGGQVRLYLNGNLLNSTAAGGAPRPNGLFRLGFIENHMGAPWVGLVDGFRWLVREMSPTEVAARYGAFQ